MKKTNTTMKKTIAIMMIFATLVSLVACGAAEPAGASNATGNPTDNEQMQATGSVPTSEGDKQGEQGETTTGQTGDGTSGSSEAADPSTQASTADPTTEPGTDKTEPTQPSESQPTEPTTQPTQPTTPTQPQPTEPPHQHSYTSTVVAPTCNDKGYTKHTCSCGDSYKDNYTDALGHHFIDEVVAPTSTEKGYTKHTCDRCWYSYKDNYTDPVKQVYDINAAMEKANAYALSLGFACIDYSLTPANAGYYPPTYAEGDSITRIGGQEWLEQETMAGARSCMYNLIGIRGENAHAACACRAYIEYDAAADAYTIYFLYA